MNQAGSSSSPVAVGLSLSSMLNTEYSENCDKLEAALHITVAQVALFRRKSPEVATFRRLDDLKSALFQQLKD